jgi:hypothetical protein
MKLLEWVPSGMGKGIPQGKDSIWTLKVTGDLAIINKYKGRKRALKML